MTAVFVKRRQPAASGSIPERLEMFSREVRFYLEVAPDVGVRVPACQRAEIAADGSTLLELEDLSTWTPTVDPVAGAQALSVLHARWEGRAVTRWPWLPRPDASDLVERLYGERWPALLGRADLTPTVRNVGERLLGRVVEADRGAAASGPTTLAHGDASAPNMRTDPATGEVALLDWEDVGAGPGVLDLAWFLVSSVDPDTWDEALAAYGNAPGLESAVPAALVQAVLSLSFEEDGGEDAAEWQASVAAAAERWT
jgi:hypothetical protein